MPAARSPSWPAAPRVRGGPGPSYNAGMPGPDTTSWDLIVAAARGDGKPAGAFAERYGVFVRECLAARWRGSPLLAELDDAVQDVFVECFREGGALQRADPERGARFRAFLAGVVRNVAHRHEAAHSRGVGFDTAAEDELPDGERGASAILDRAWMRMLVRNAGERFLERCAGQGAAGGRRWEVLRLRFEEGLPVREIAARLRAPPDKVHQEYRRARRVFRSCLEEELAVHGGSADGVRRLWRELLDLL